MNKKYIVDLQKEERRKLQRIIHSGKHSARKIRWAHALLKADNGWKDEKIAEVIHEDFLYYPKIEEQLAGEPRGIGWPIPFLRQT